MGASELWPAERRHHFAENAISLMWELTQNQRPHLDGVEAVRTATKAKYAAAQFFFHSLTASESTL